MKEKKLEKRPHSQMNAKMVSPISRKVNHTNIWNHSNQNFRKQNESAWKQNQSMKESFKLNYCFQMQSLGIHTNSNDVATAQ